MAVSPAIRNYAFSIAILVFLSLSGKIAPPTNNPLQQSSPTGATGSLGGDPDLIAAPLPGAIPVVSDTCRDPTVYSLEAFFTAKEPKQWWYQRPYVQFMPPEFHSENIRTIYNLMQLPAGIERNESRGWPKNDFLEKAIKEHIGVYLDPPAGGGGADKDQLPSYFSYNPKLKAPDERTRRKFANTVMVASANYGYLDFILNWICNTRAVGNYRPLLVAQDTSLHTHIMERQLPVASFLGSHINVSSFSRATNFYEGSGFAKVSMMKVIAARAILESGRDVFFSDVDVAFAKDPLPFFRGDVDFEFQSNHWMPEFMSSSEPNTGFYLMRSNPRTIRYLWEGEKYCEKLGNVDDQTCLGAVLRLWTQQLKAVYVPLTVPEGMVDQYLATMGYCRQRVFTFRQLHPTIFPPGFLYFFNLKTEYHKFLQTAPEAVQPAAMHVNYVAGHDPKKSALKESNLWVYDENKSKDGEGPKGEHAKLVCMDEGDDD